MPFQIVHEGGGAGSGEVQDPKIGEGGGGRGGIDEGFDVGLDLCGEGVLEVVAKVAMREESLKTNDLGKDTLKKHLHHDRGVREDGSDDLSFLPDCYSDFVV